MDNEISFKKTYQVNSDLISNQYQHVHHADIFRLLERARADCIAENGQPLESFIQEGLFIVISSINIEFKREVKLGQVDITCENVKINRRQILVEQRIISEADKELVSAVVDLRVLSKELGRSITVPDRLKSAFGLLERRL